MPSILVMGLQWGDEGKGRIIDHLAKGADAAVRYNGGANAGHTIIGPGGVRSVVHQLPSGVLTPGVVCLLGRGMVIDPAALAAEISGLGIDTSRVSLDPAAHVTLPLHREEDVRLEIARGCGGVGTTRSGNGPTYAAKAQRFGVRIADLVTDPHAAARRLTISGVPLERAEAECTAALAALADCRMTRRLSNVPQTLHEMDQAGSRILFECAHGFELDLDHGDYPNVTSSSCSVGGVCSGAGFDPRRIRTVIGVIKPYSTRVGAGRMLGEYDPERSAEIREAGHEYGSTTGRPRRIAALDLGLLRRACIINGVDRLAITHMDVAEMIGDLSVVSLSGIVHRSRWNKLIPLIEAETGVRVQYMCHGPQTKDMVEYGNSVWEV